MSILIKVMTMPRGCDECYIREKDTCPLLKVNVGEWGRMLNCPLVELPDHGDLVDRDELMMKMWEASAYAPNHCSWVNARVVFAKDIEDAPVVIPAERSEDGET